MPEDLQVVQAAAALERLAVSTYSFAVGLPFLAGADANPLLKRFATTTMQQHAEHARAFTVAIRNLGGKDEGQPDVGLVQSVEAAKAASTAPDKMIDLALLIEQTLTESYVTGIGALADPVGKQIMSSIVGVESQHGAVLRLFRALIAGDEPLIALPTDVARLPATIGSAGSPRTFAGAAPRPPGGGGPS